jgi:hypothetical protein
MLAVGAGERVGGRCGVGCLQVRVLDRTLRAASITSKRPVQRERTLPLSNRYQAVKGARDLRHTVPKSAILVSHLHLFVYLYLYLSAPHHTTFVYIFDYNLLSLIKSKSMNHNTTWHIRVGADVKKQETAQKKQVVRDTVLVNARYWELVVGGSDYKGSILDKNYY